LYCSLTEISTPRPETIDLPYPKKTHQLPLLFRAMVRDGESPEYAASLAGVGRCTLDSPGLEHQHYIGQYQREKFPVTQYGVALCHHVLAKNSRRRDRLDVAGDWE
jgi:hypothetical protein